MPTTTDVIVAGLGAMGSAALYHLARRGASVVGFDRHLPPHPLGSTHGLSRIIREAYYEHPLYVPLVQRAYELWSDLESRTGHRLFRRTGGLMIGLREGTLVAGARRSAVEHGLPFEELPGAEVTRRFPAFTIPGDMVALLEPRAGVLDPEGCVSAHLALAKRAGAEVRANEPILTWRVDSGQVEVTTASGSFHSKRLALCTGAWTPGLLGELAAPLSVERQVMHWFTPAREASLFSPARCPIAMIEYDTDRFFYTLPDSGAGLKAAIHHEGEPATPETVRREVGADDVSPVRALLERYLPHAAGALRASATCLYTNTPDHHFLIDAHPAHAEVLIVSACSGHGFKFASAIGEVVADLLTDAAPKFDVGVFGGGRLTAWKGQEVKRLGGFQTF